LISLFAYVSIPLPFTPVPLATQGTLIFLLSVLLGSKRASAAVALLLAQGAFGLPVFGPGLVGLARFAGPTGGYLIGYFVAAYAVGKVTELLGKKTLTNACIAMLIGNVILLALGAIRLSMFLGLEKALLLGVVPFLLGDLLKIAVGLKILQWLGWSR
jgi:biotin transport system substrate-specific component